MRIFIIIKLFIESIETEDSKNIYFIKMHSIWILWLRIIPSAQIILLPTAQSKSFPIWKSIAVFVQSDSELSKLIGMDSIPVGLLNRTNVRSELQNGLIPTVCNSLLRAVLETCHHYLILNGEDGCPALIAQDLLAKSSTWQWTHFNDDLTPSHTLFDRRPTEKFYSPKYSRQQN